MHCLRDRKTVITQSTSMNPLEKMHIILMPESFFLLGEVSSISNQPFSFKVAPLKDFLFDYALHYVLLWPFTTSLAYSSKYDLQVDVGKLSVPLGRKEVAALVLEKISIASAALDQESRIESYTNNDEQKSKLRADSSGENSDEDFSQGPHGSVKVLEFLLGTIGIN